MKDEAQIYPKYVRLTFLQWLTRSVDTRLYQLFYNAPPKLFIYYFSLAIITGVAITSIALSWQTYTFLTATADLFETELPVLEFNDGILTPDSTTPVRYNVDQFQIVIDTTSKSTELDPFFSQGIILLKDRMKFMFPNQTPQEVEYSSVGLTTATIDADSIRSSRIIAAIFVLIFLGGLRVLLWGVFKSFQVAVGISVVNMITQTRGFQAPPTDRIAIATTALIPSIALHCLEIIFKMTFPGFIFLYLGVYGVFLLLGTASYLQRAFPTHPADAA